MLVAYRGLIASLFGLSGHAHPVDCASRIVAFEAALAAAFLPSSALRDPVATYNAKPLAEVQSLMAGAVDVVAALSPLMPKGLPEGAVVQSPAYFANVSAVLMGAPQTTVVEYLQWRALQSKAPLLTQVGPLFSSLSF